MLTREEYLSKIDEYVENLRNGEKSENTIRQYKLGINTFRNYADSNGMQNPKSVKPVLLKYKKYLEEKYTLSTANLYIIALNNYLKYLKNPDLCLETLKVQEQQYTLENSLTMDEYTKMVNVAKK